MFDVLLTAALLTILPIWIMWHVRRARRIVRQWAASSGYEVEKFLWTAHSISPFPLNSFGKQSIRRVRLRDSDGRQRVAWLLLGDAVIGLLDDRVKEVSWEG